MNLVIHHEINNFAENLHFLFVHGQIDVVTIYCFTYVEIRYNEEDAGLCTAAAYFKNHPVHPLTETHPIVLPDGLDENSAPPGSVREGVQRGGRGIGERLLRFRF